jgi:DNA ligase (NAD+)
MGLKRAQTIIREIKKTLNTTPEKLLKSFGIPGIGNTVSKMVLNTYNDFDSLFDKDVSDFTGIDGVGDVLAENLVSGLSKNRGLYEFLKDRGLKFEEKASMDLQGKIFTLTGKPDINRNDLSKMISQHGGMVKGISKSTTYLVTNDMNSTSGKMKKAIAYGVSIITYDDLLNMIRS